MTAFVRRCDIGRTRARVRGGPEEDPRQPPGHRFVSAGRWHQILLRRGGRSPRRRHAAALDEAADLVLAEAELGEDFLACARRPSAPDARWRQASRSSSPPVPPPSHGRRPGARRRRSPACGDLRVVGGLQMGLHLAAPDVDGQHRVDQVGRRPLLGERRDLLPDLVALVEQRASGRRRRAGCRRRARRPAWCRGSWRSSPSRRRSDRRRTAPPCRDGRYRSWDA